MPNQHAYNGSYRGEHLSRVAFPLGGIGAGMICLEGVGAVSHVSVRHEPQVYNEPGIIAAVCVRGQANTARVLEGPVPGWKVMFPWGTGLDSQSGNGGGGRTFGLPRMTDAEFASRFPFATVRLADPALPLDVAIDGWSPFVPPSADESSLPVAALEYTFANRGEEPVEAVFSFHAPNFMRRGAGEQPPPSRVRPLDGGFVLEQDGSDEAPEAEGAFAVRTEAEGATVDCAWFRGGWFDTRTMLWRRIAAGEPVASRPPAEGGPSGGGSLYVPLAIPPGERRTVRLQLSWYVPHTTLRSGKEPDDAEVPAAATGCRTPGDAGARPTHQPWYAARFAGIDDVAAYWRAEYDRLRVASQAFADCFFDTTLPPEVVEAVAANLTILKSPTVLRQADGRIWAWEGCCDSRGCCPGSCTHVWNYAQAMGHLFPSLERSLRQTEFHECQAADGYQVFRAPLPIRPAVADRPPAADGQLGGIMKVHRDWHVSGDTDWLRGIWPQVRRSLDYCIAHWDAAEEGCLREPHHNTYDIEFWGPDGMCGSIYVGALRAAVRMGEALGEDVRRYRQLCGRAVRFMEAELFNGEYFFQQVQWQGLERGDPAAAMRNYSPEARALAEREGPKYQYGSGCLADGVLGAWLAEVCGVGDGLDPDKVRSHLLAVHRHNFRQDLSTHANPQRPTYALNDEAGLVLCTWPRGGRPHLPFPYSSEVWTGFEYQVASHLMMHGRVAEGLQIVRAARDRYDGRIRNAFNEYECGHWYARAMSSYALLQGLAGLRYSAVERALWLWPRVAERPLRAFLATAGGFGTVELTDAAVRVSMARGELAIDRLCVGGGEPQPLGRTVTAAPDAPAVIPLDDAARERLA
jgi:hypothetical protein